MLAYLIPFLVELVGLDRRERSQVLSRVLLLPTRELVHIDSDDRVWTEYTHLHEQFEVGPVIVGLAVWADTLFLLTEEGDLFQADGTLVRENIQHVQSKVSDKWLLTQSVGGDWLAKLDPDTLVGEEDGYIPSEVQLPKLRDITAATVRDTSAFCYVKDCRAYVRWLEYNTLLVPRRRWIHLVGDVEGNNLFERMVDEYDRYWAVRTESRSDRFCLFLGDRMVNLVELCGHERESEDDVGGYVHNIETFAVEAVESIHYHFTDSIADAQFFFTGVNNTDEERGKCEGEITDEKCEFIVLFENGSLYLSPTKSIVNLRTRVIATSTIKDRQVLVLFEDDTIERYHLGCGLELVE